MIYEFWYEGDLRHLTEEEVAALEAEIESVIPNGRGGDFNCLCCENGKLDISGWFDDEYADHGDLESILDKYDVDWKGCEDVAEPEPDWDKMPGGYDTLWA